MEKLKEELLRELIYLHRQKELAHKFSSDYFEPHMTEYADQSDGIYDLVSGEITMRFQSKGTRYEGRTEQIEKVKNGDPIKVVRDKNSSINPNNFLLMTMKDKDVGLMPLELCNVIAPLYDSGVLTFCGSKVSFVEPISKRSRYAKKAILFVELKAKFNDSKTD